LGCVVVARRRREPRRRTLTRAGRDGARARCRRVPADREARAALGGTAAGLRRRALQQPLAAAAEQRAAASDGLRGRGERGGAVCRRREPNGPADVRSREAPVRRGRGAPVAPRRTPALPFVRDAARHGAAPVSFALASPEIPMKYRVDIDVANDTKAG